MNLKALLIKEAIHIGLDFLTGAIQKDKPIDHLSQEGIEELLKLSFRDLKVIYTAGLITQRLYGILKYIKNKEKEIYHLENN